MKYDRQVKFIIGNILFGAGISLCNRSLFGSNPMNLFVAGVADKLLWDIGLVNFIIGILELIIGYILDKENVSIFSFLSLFVTSWSISLVSGLVAPGNNILIRLLLFVSGCIIYSFGLAIQQAYKCGYGNYDCYIFGLRKALKLQDYHSARWIADGLFLLGGILLGKGIGWGTIAILLFIGYLVEYCLKIVNKFRKDR